MKKITYYASNDKMGDISDLNCDNFRAWAKSAIENEYPDFNVEVSDCVCLRTVDIDGTHDDDREEINEFCHCLWENAPDHIWYFEND